MLGVVPASCDRAFISHHGCIADIAGLRTRSIFISGLNSSSSLACFTSSSSVKIFQVFSSSEDRVIDLA